MISSSLKIIESGAERSELCESEVWECGCLHFIFFFFFFFSIFEKHQKMRHEGKSSGWGLTSS